MEIKEGAVDDKDLQKLSQELGDSWVKLGWHLGFKKAQMTGFKKDHEEYSEKALGMLQKWKERDGSDATYRALYDALCHDLVSRKDLAEKFCIAF